MSIKSFVTKNISPNLEKQGLKNSVAFDPTIIITIISVITTLISDCDLFKKKPEEIREVTKKIGVFERWILRQRVRQEIDDNQVFKQVGAQIVNALVEVGPQASVEDIAAAIAEVRD